MLIRGLNRIGFDICDIKTPAEGTKRAFPTDIIPFFIFFIRTFIVFC